MSLPDQMRVKPGDDDTVQILNDDGSVQYEFPKYVAVKIEHTITHYKDSLVGMIMIKKLCDDEGLNDSMKFKMIKLLVEKELMAAKNCCEEVLDKAKDRNQKVWEAVDQIVEAVKNGDDIELVHTVLDDKDHVVKHLKSKGFKNAPSPKENKSFWSNKSKEIKDRVKKEGE